MSAATVTLFRGVCPNCHQDKIFKNWFVMKDRCDNCGAVYMRDPGSWTGSTGLSMMLGAILGCGTVALLWATGTLYSVPAMVVSGGICAIIFVSMHFTKAIWLGLLFDWGLVYPDPVEASPPDTPAP